MQTTAALGTTIRARREELGLTRDQLIAKVEGLSLSTLVRIELRAGMPRVETLAGIAKALDLSVDALLSAETSSDSAEQVSA